MSCFFNASSLLLLLFELYKTLVSVEIARVSSIFFQKSDQMSHVESTLLKYLQKNTKTRNHRELYTITLQAAQNFFWS